MNLWYIGATPAEYGWAFGKAFHRGRSHEYGWFPLCCCLPPEDWLPPAQLLTTAVWPLPGFRIKMPGDALTHLASLMEASEIAFENYSTKHDFASGWLALESTRMTLHKNDFPSVSLIDLPVHISLTNDPRHTPCDQRHWDAGIQGLRASLLPPHRFRTKRARLSHRSMEEDYVCMDLLVDSELHCELHRLLFKFFKDARLPRNRRRPNFHLSFPVVALQQTVELRITSASSYRPEDYPPHLPIPV